MKDMKRNAARTLQKIFRAFSEEEEHLVIEI